MFMQDMEGCYTEEDIDVDGISTDSDETQLNNESMNLPVKTHVSKLEKLYMKLCKKADCFPFLSGNRRL